MTDGESLGCLGTLIALFAVAILGWLGIELLITVGSTSPVTLMHDPGFVHQLGQFLVLGGLTVGIYAAIFRRGGLQSRGMTAISAVLWSGAILELVAWAITPSGVRWRLWALMIGVLGALGPMLVRSLGRRERIPQQPGF